MKIIISKAPKDPKERDEWAKAMAELQISAWVRDGATCIECGHRYRNPDDFKRRNPKQGHTKKLSFVCKDCYPIYKKKV